MARGRSGIGCDTTGGPRVAGDGMPKCDGSSLLDLPGIEMLGNPRFLCADGGRLSFVGDFSGTDDDFRRSFFTSFSVEITSIFRGEPSSLPACPVSLMDFLVLPEILSRCETFAFLVLALRLVPCTGLPFSSTSTTYAALGPLLEGIVEPLRRLLCVVDGVRYLFATAGLLNLDAWCEIVVEVLVGWAETGMKFKNYGGAQTLLLGEGFAGRKSSSVLLSIAAVVTRTRKMIL